MPRPNDGRTMADRAHIGTYGAREATEIRCVRIPPRALWTMKVLIESGTRPTTRPIK